MIDRFHQPGTVPEALRLKRGFRDRAAFLAGGTLLNSSEGPAVLDHVISLAGLGLDRIESNARAVTIGARCTLQQLIDHRLVPAPLKSAARQVLSRNIRNMATLGGHLAANLPWSDVIPMLVALEAKVTLATDRGAKTLAVADYVRTAPAGLVTRIALPKRLPARAAACRNARASALARSTVSVAVSLAPGRKAIGAPIVAVGGIERHVVRLAAVEQALDGKPLPEPDALQALVARALKPLAGLPGSVALRRTQAAALVALACADAASGGRP